MISKKKIKIAIDSPAAAGAGTQAKLISKYYNLFYLDTGKIYRLIASCLSGFSLTVLTRLGHAQLMPAFAGILAMDAFISSLSIISIKKNKVLIKKINGNISNNIEGIFRRVK